MLADHPLQATASERGRILTAAFPSQPQPSFGFNGVGELTFYRTYSRLLDDGRSETWADVIRRCVEATFRDLQPYRLGWSPEERQQHAHAMAERIYRHQFHPPGRSLWLRGTRAETLKGALGLNNCAYVSTKHINHLPTAPFEFMMDASMLGTGVGFDTRGAGKLVIQRPSEQTLLFPIPDTREGWVESLRLLLLGYFVPGQPQARFDYRQIRPYGAPIKTFGGTASGPEPLRRMHRQIRHVLDRHIGQPISERDIVDIMNLIGGCVVAGNVRRTAQIALGTDHADYLNLKNYQLHPERAEYGWTSNNSVLAHTGTDYAAIAERIVHDGTGEPGLFWLENCQAYGRMDDAPDWADRAALGTNPCVPAGTRILTRSGYQAIDTLVGQEVQVWNGHEWSTVTPRITGHEQPLVQVHLRNDRGDQCALRCTPSHRFMLANGVRRTASALRPGDRLMRFGRPDGFTGVYHAEWSLRVQQVTPSGTADTVYCFIEPIRHLGCFEGIVTGQCSEQTLHDGEVCNLAEVYIHHHATREDFLQTLFYAYLYAKTVTLLPIHQPRTAEVVERNRRLGISLAGVAQFCAARGDDELIRWCQAGYQHLRELDRYLSPKLWVPTSIKLTSIKPGGSVPLLAGATPGMHWPIAPYYIRRIRIAASSPYVPALEAAHYPIEPTTGDPKTLVVEFPVSVGTEVPCEQDVPVWTQVRRQQLLQRYWSDNQVSGTLKFHLHEAEQIEPILREAATTLKSISFLAHTNTVYTQMPYEAISPAAYQRRLEALGSLNLAAVHGDGPTGTSGCDGDSCSLF